MGTDVVTDATFDIEVLACELPVLVDFWAPWCGPCLQLAPILDDWARNHPGIRAVKINADEETAVATRYGVTSLPTLALFEAGRMVRCTSDASSRSVLRRTLEDWLT